MKNVLYIHGYNSSFTELNLKVAELKKHYNVLGITLDYKTLTFNEIMLVLSDFIIDNGIDVIVGSSFGGFLANHSAAKFGLPCIVINPVVDPYVTVSKYDANHKNTFPLTMTSYRNTLVLLDEGDCILPHHKTVETLNDSVYKIVVFSGGDHRFRHIEESIEHIETFLNINDASNGITG